MKAVRVLGPKDIRLDDEAPAPEPPGRGEVLVAPTVAGICGTDLKEFLGVGVSIPTKPQILGHEFAARVVEVGAGVEGVEPGDRVAVMPFQHCGRCPHCRRGEYILCPHKTITGLSQPGGGFGDLALVRDYQVTPLEGLTDVQGALIEPGAVSLNAVMSAGVEVGDSVLIVGGGPVGSLAVLCALAAGAIVYVSEPNDRRRELVRQLGAIVVSGDRSGQLEELLEVSGGYGLDRAVDCAGKPGTVDFCIAAVRYGGTISVPAVHAGSTDIDIRTVTRRAVTLRGSLGYTGHVWERTVAMIRDGSYPVERIVTSRIDREAIITDGFEALSDPDRGQVKILVDVSE